MKKLTSLLLAVVMIAALCVPFTVSAADDVMSADVKTSISEDVTGLAFIYTMNVKEIVYHGNRTFDAGKILVDGELCDLVTMGAIVSNNKETGSNPAAMTVENAAEVAAANPEATNRALHNVEGKKMFDWNQDEGWLRYAIRVINIPDTFKKSQIYARSYYTYKDASGTEETIYGAIEMDSYEKLTLPEIGTDIDVVKQKGRIRVSATDYTVKENGIDVSLTFKNDTKNWITEETDYVKYTCYDADDNQIGNEEFIYIGCIDTKKHPVKTFTFTVPGNTAKVVLTNSKIVYWTEWA